MVNTLRARWIAPVGFALLTISLVAVQAAQTVNLTGYWQDDLGGKYAVRQIGSAVHWIADARQASMSTFDGVMSGDSVFGQWVDVPGGTRNTTGELAFCIDTQNRLVKTYSTGYGASVLTRVGTAPTSGPGKCNAPTNSPAAGVGSTGAPGAPARPGMPPSPPPATGTGGTRPAGTGAMPTTATDGITFVGENLRFFGASTNRECDTACQNDPKCRAWSWVKPGAFNPGDPAMCYLMARVDNMAPSRCCIAAVRPANAPAPASPLVVNMVGTWTGQQRCADGGVWNHTVTVQKQDGTTFTGVFNDGSEFTGTLDGNKVTLDRRSWNARWDGTMTATAMQGSTFQPASSPAPQCTFVLTRAR